MSTREINTAQLTAIMANLAELHEWELVNAPIVGSLTGRHLYYRIAQRAVGDRTLLSRALKASVYYLPRPTSAADLALMRVLATQLLDARAQRLGAVYHPKP